MWLTRRVRLLSPALPLEDGAIPAETKDRLIRGFFCFPGSVVSDFPKREPSEVVPMATCNDDSRPKIFINEA